tara:strand:+ start:774 stop:929 length:156 start_codon:yes stop_codon:yes gene_type:complete
MAIAQVICALPESTYASSCGADCDSPYGAMQGKIVPQVATTVALHGGFTAA